MATHTHSLVFYGLSTCIHCKHTREFLEENHVQFELHYVDLAEGQERESLVNKIRGYNPSVSFPTLVIDDSKVIVGFQKEAIAEALEL
ncbi:glutaredoxin family protein [Desulfovibrio sp. OttesenSCG-928-G15]|nr:glutaredoxin family protein [Desulfovibrio sp. OttesenSCG-928-G15]